MTRANAAQLLRPTETYDPAPTGPVGMVYASLEAFYAAVPARHDSSERDFGLWWKDHVGAVYRAAWVAETRELYVCQYLATRGDGHVEVLGRVDLTELEQRLRGWRDVCGSPRSLEWLSSRAARGPRSGPRRRPSHRPRRAHPASR
jgi:hypothetical protein